jgi:hypothetical protein
VLDPLPELLSAALSRPANPPLAVLAYSESERPFDIGLLIFSSVAFIGFAIRAYRGSRKEVRTKQTKAARFILIPLAVIIVLLITGILHLRP